MPFSPTNFHRAAIYARVSTARQAEADLSIPDQVKQTTAFCKKRGWTVVETFIEPGASATDDKRPVFLEMMERAQGSDRPFDVIVVHSLSRFFRDAMKFEFYLRALRKRGVQIVAITQELSADPTGELLRKILLSFDEYSSQENAKHTLRAMRENARQGFWNGALPPFGYKTVNGEKRGPKTKKALTIDSGEAALVRQVFDMYLGVAGPQRGVKAIAVHLNESGKRYRGKLFSNMNVHRMLTESAYRGVHYFGRKNSRTGEIRSRSEWVELTTPIIVPPETFDRVQAFLHARNPKHTPPRVVSGPTLLAGLAKCASCGGAMVIRTGKGGRYRYYTCVTCAKRGKQACKGRSVPMGLVDNLILDHLAERLFTSERLRQILVAHIEKSASDDHLRKERIGRLKAELTNTEGGIQRLLQLVQMGHMEADDPALKDRLAPLKARREEIKREIRDAEDQRGERPRQITAAMIDRFGATMRDRLKNGSTEFRQAYLRLFVGKIEIDDEEIRMSGPRSALARAVKSDVPPEQVLVPSFIQDWRPRRDSNPRPQD